MSRLQFLTLLFTVGITFIIKKMHDGFGYKPPPKLDPEPCVVPAEDEDFEWEELFDREPDCTGSKGKIRMSLYIRLLLYYYHHLISMLSLCYLCAISMLSLCYLYAISMLSLCYLYAISMLSLCYLHAISML